MVCGPVEDLLTSETSITGAYLSGRREIAIPLTRRPRESGRKLSVVGARENNLLNVTVDFPLGQLISVTGVSGSGKSSLVNDILYAVLANRLNGARMVPGRHTRVTGLDQVDKVVGVDQSPIGRTPRSNPATYTGVFDKIRNLFASTTEAKVRGYLPGRFSFNVKGGRCEACSGDGTIKIEMNFLPDIYVPCEVCKGARYNRETLEVHYKGKTIAEVLDTPIDEAAEFFEPITSIHRYLKTLVDVGLGYVRLGQPAPTLSGGEAQRVKLASELQKRSTGRTVYVLDEPTTGLHFADVEKLLLVLNGLVDKGNTVIVIEHNLDVIKTSDYVIDMGPEGGSGGGTVIATGTPEEIAEHPASYTGQFLEEVLAGRAARPATRAGNGANGRTTTGTSRGTAAAKEPARTSTNGSANGSANGSMNGSAGGGARRSANGSAAAANGPTANGPHGERQPRERRLRERHPGQRHPGQRRGRIGERRVRCGRRGRPINCEAVVGQVRDQPDVGARRARRARCGGGARSGRGGRGGEGCRGEGPAAGREAALRRPLTRRAPFGAAGSARPKAFVVPRCGAVCLPHHPGSRRPPAS